MFADGVKAVVSSRPSAVCRNIASILNRAKTWNQACTARKSRLLSRTRGGNKTTHQRVPPPQKIYSDRGTLWSQSCWNISSDRWVVVAKKHERSFYTFTDAILSKCKGFIS